MIWIGNLTGTNLPPAAEISGVIPLTGVTPCNMKVLRLQLTILIAFSPHCDSEYKCHLAGIGYFFVDMAAMAYGIQSHIFFGEYVRQLCCGAIYATQCSMCRQ